MIYTVCIQTFLASSIMTVHAMELRKFVVMLFQGILSSYFEKSWVSYTVHATRNPPIHIPVDELRPQ